MRNRSEDQITLVLIRHGQTRSNKEKRYVGKTDEPLSEAGKQSLEEKKQQRLYPEIERLFTSPMKRCIQTAEILYPDLEPVPIEEWTEMDFGAFEGKNYMELQKDERYQAWVDSDGSLPFPEGESREEFLSRCEKGFDRMRQEVFKRNKHQGLQTIGIIVHGGTIMTLLSRYAGGDCFKYQVENGRGYLCRVKDLQKQPRLTELRKL